MGAADIATAGYHGYHHRTPPPEGVTPHIAPGGHPETLLFPDFIRACCWLVLLPFLCSTDEAYLLPLPVPPLSTAVQVQLCRRWGESRRCTHTSTEWHMHTARGDALTVRGLTHSRLQILANAAALLERAAAQQPHKHSWSGLETVALSFLLLQRESL